MERGLEAWGRVLALLGLGLGTTLTSTLCAFVSSPVKWNVGLQGQVRTGGPVPVDELWPLYGDKRSR